MDLPILLLNPDEKLEDLRKDVPDPPDVSSLVDDWLLKGQCYSMKKLASDCQLGWEVLHTVAKFVDGTPVGSNGDWKDFAHCLGLDYHSIVKIENFSTIKGAAMEILSLYTLKKDSTITGLVKALNQMERFDILLAISDNVIGLLEPSTNRKKESYLSETSSCIVGRFVGEADLANLESVPCQSTSKSTSNKLKKTVLLTFAQDGQEFATHVANRIRSLNLDIGVLILEENKEELEICPESIYRWAQEVDYIIPIITEGYLWLIAPRSVEEDLVMGSEEEPWMDTRYARLIYVMMVEEYVRKGCLNYRVRPLESVGTNGKPIHHSLLFNPLFSCRKKLDQVDQLTAVLAKAKTRPKIFPKHS